MRMLAGLLVAGWCAVALAWGCSSSNPDKSAPCAGDSECPSGLHCDAKLGCSQCLFDAQCSAAQRCQAGQCITRVSCQSSKDCVGALNAACDSDLHECFACAADADCKGGQRCRSQACTTITACAADTDCSGGSVCDQKAHECVECNSAADCRSSGICSNHRCLEACSEDFDCVDHGLVCDRASGTCQQCVVTADCPSSFHCTANRCERDVCSTGETRCAGQSAAVEVCSPAGDRWLTLFCSDTQSCEVSGGKAGCANWTCVPNTIACSADQRRIERCSDDGTSTSVDSECDAGQKCLEGSCKPDACAPNETFCRAGSVYKCAIDGTASALSESCATGSHCDDSTAACVPDVCKPGADVCQGNQIAHCKGDGSGLEDVKECGKKQVCREGACRSVVCDPNTSVCEGDQIKSCNENGTTLTVTKTCDGDEHCGLSGNVPSCIPNICTSFQLECQGDLVTQCNTAGTAFEPVTDCAASGQVCYAGACQPKLCESGTFSCQSGNVALCVHNGASNELFQTCATDQFCDSTVAACKPKICTPGVLGCNGNVLATCDGSGSSYLAAGAVDCTATNQVCEAGACKAITCTQNVLFCQSGDVFQCNALGTGAARVTDCIDSYQYCAQSGSVAFCAADVCTADMAVCNGNIAMKCNADGSGYLAGTDCGADKACIGGTCQNKICVPNALSCSNGNSVICSSQGTAYYSNQTCASTQYCSPTTGTCVQDVCPAAGQGCVGEVLGTCNAEGSALATGGTDCKASGQLCTLSGCAATATDTLGASVSSSSGSSDYKTYGAVVYVTAARELTGIQLYFAGIYTPSVRWVVYASTTQSGPYTPVFDKPIPPTSNTSTSSLQSSGAISVQLSPGRFYYFGVQMTGYTDFGYESTSAQRYTSFGHALGAYSAATQSTPPTSFTFSPNTNYPAMTLLTKLP